MHVSRAMQAARRRSGFDFTRRLGRRTEAGPRQVLARVRRRFGGTHDKDKGGFNPLANYDALALGFAITGLRG
jgi:hypothetical protein